jgi:AbrB family looped-hinge helix DNA binding protein
MRAASVVTRASYVRPETRVSSADALLVLRSGAQEWHILRHCHRFTSVALSEHMARTNPLPIRLGAQGRLVVPAELREELGLGEGAELAIRSDGRRLILEPRREVLRRLRRRFAAVGDVSLGELLSADRDGEARREEED